jgi:hypothetical protein
MPDGPPQQTPESIADLLGWMRDTEAAFPPLDPLRHFHSVYTRTTQAVADEIRTAALGGFLDPDWVKRWDVAFAQLYLRALDARTNDPDARTGGGRVPRAGRAPPTRRRLATCCSGSTPTSTNTCPRRCWR